MSQGVFGCFLAWYQQPSLTRKKLRRLELTAGAPHQGQPGIWSANKGVRQAERRRTGKTHAKRPHTQRVSKPPRRSLQPGLLGQLALARAQTAAVTAAVIFQALYLLTCRSLTRPNREIGRWSNPAVYAGILAVLALQVAFFTLPPMHDLFGSARLDLQALALGASLLVFPVTWVEERWRVRRG